MFTNKDIEDYYDFTQDHYRLHWDLDRSRALHYGLWKPDTKSFHEALVNTNKELSRRASIDKDDLVLDAGCGIGGSSLWLAANIGCAVTGIALNEKQLAIASKLANTEKLDSLTHFQKADFTDTPFDDDSFSVIWAVESVCHANDKTDFLKEAYRLLKPGGRLIMCDYFKQPDLTRKEERIILNWINRWAISDISEIIDFQDVMIHSGFKDIQIEDVTKSIIPSSKRMSKAFYIGIIPTLIYRLFHPKASKQGMENVLGAYHQYKGLKKGLWSYRIIYAEKH